MANSKEIKNRIKSVKSTKKITKAMELVAASKMKKVVSSTISSRLYAEYSWEILTSIAKNVEGISHPLFAKSDTKGQYENINENLLLILITSNRGLCGSYNAQVVKKALSLIKNKSEGASIDIISIGKKGDTLMRRINKNIIASFFELPSSVSLSDVMPISHLAISEFNLGHYDRVLVAYTDYVSAILQRPRIKQVIPVSRDSLRELIEELGDNSQNKEIETQNRVNYLVEGDRNALIGTLAEKIVRMQIYQMILESSASEQSARMLAMKNATDAAGDMIDDLTLVFNKVRQANITREISEVSAGMASVN